MHIYRNGRVFYNTYRGHLKHFYYYWPFCNENNIKLGQCPLNPVFVSHMFDLGLLLLVAHYFQAVLSSAVSYWAFIQTLLIYLEDIEYESFVENYVTAWESTVYNCRSL